VRMISQLIPWLCCWLQLLRGYHHSSSGESSCDSQTLSLWRDFAISSLHCSLCLKGETENEQVTCCSLAAHRSVNALLFDEKWHEDRWATVSWCWGTRTGGRHLQLKFKIVIISAIAEFWILWNVLR
jgi:hypothetical protein